MAGRAPSASRSHTPSRRAAAAALGAAAALALGAAAPRALGAQLAASGTLDVGAASVTYDEYLRSGVLSVTPAVRLDGPRGLATLRLNGTRFESGSGSVGADVGATLLLGGGGGPVRGELSAAAGRTWYREGAPDASDASLALRLRGDGRSGGLWAEAGGGAVHLPGGDRGVVRGGVGGWRRAGALTLGASALATAVGGMGYVDGELSARLPLRAAALDLSAGRRLGETGGGVRGWGEAGLTWWATRRLALVVGAGAYPADLGRGAPGGRYAAAAARVSTGRRFSPAAGSALARLARLREAAAERRLAPAAPAVELGAASGRLRPLRVRLPDAAGAAVVEVMGDFTGWEPVRMARVANDVWAADVQVAPGVHRFNVRVDGGAWTVPPGAPVGEDEFGGVAALLVVR